MYLNKLYIYIYFVDKCHLQVADQNLASLNQKNLKRNHILMKKNKPKIAVALEVPEIKKEADLIQAEEKDKETQAPIEGEETRTKFLNLLSYLLQTLIQK
jgi:hypothetical protein